MNNSNRRYFIKALSIIGLSQLRLVKYSDKFKFLTPKALWANNLKPNDPILPNSPFIVDVHCHPSQKSFLLKFKMWKHHHPRSGDNYFHMQLDIYSLMQGNVRGMLAAHYLVENGMKYRSMFGDHIPLIKLLYPSLLSKVEKGTGANFYQLQKMMLALQDQVDKTNKKIGTEVLKIVDSYEKFVAAISNGQIAIAHAVEGSQALGRNMKPEQYIKNIDILAINGVCLITLSHFFANDLSFPVEGMSPDDKKGLKLDWDYDPETCDIGLTCIGETVVTRMLERGIIVDMTHMTPAGRSDVFKINEEFNRKHNFRRPLIFTHTGAQGLVDEYEKNTKKNTTYKYKNFKYMAAKDDEIKSIKKCGGTIGVIFENFWLIGNDVHTHTNNTTKAQFKNGIKYVIQTIEYIKKILPDDGTDPITGKEFAASYDNISIGSDFDGFACSPSDLTSPKDFPKLIDHMLAHFRSQTPRMSEEEITAVIYNITHGNALRVLEKGWGNSVIP